MGLYARIAVGCIAIATGTLIVSLLSFMGMTHYHLGEYQRQVAHDPLLENPVWIAHFEQAVAQSALLAGVAAICLATGVSLLVAKRITSPLHQMKAVAGRMAQGEYATRTQVRGNDELAALGASLNELAEQLARQEQLRRHLTADVAHELRTPLSTLKSHLEAILEGVWEPTPVRMRSCHEEVERLHEMVRELEQLTEVEAPHLQLDWTKEHLGEFARQYAEGMRALFMQKGIHLHLDPPAKQDDSCVAWTDRRRLAQVLGNVLGNALKYTPHGGTVTVTVIDEPQWVSIIVSDTGIGIPAADLPFVFERFYRVDKSRDRKTGGNGIGLAIVHKVIEALGGTVHLESVEQQGTRVTIRCPKQRR